jgi:hypothetical protein
MAGGVRNGMISWHIHQEFDGRLIGKNRKFFSDLGLKQILSGYYDGDENGDAIKQCMDNTKSVPGITGAMYTTWESKYGAMGPWAQKAWNSLRW